MLSVKDYYESMKHAKEAVTQRMKISLCYKLLLIFIRSSEPPHFSLMGKKVIWTQMYLGCLSCAFWTRQGPDERSPADLHTRQMLHLTVTAKTFSIMLKEPLFKPESNSSWRYQMFSRAHYPPVTPPGLKMMMMMQAGEDELSIQWQTVQAEELCCCK